ncbi:MAG: class I SAM-dependent methyltransferase [Solirubrobacterales bacterium]
MTTAIRLNAARELQELREYLGPAYDHAKLQGYKALVENEYRESGDEGTFYRTSEAYLYDLTAFAASGTKVPYLRMLVAQLPARARLLDYGCGIGSDGLLLLEAGYEVVFADYDNPSTRYLRWRLERRGLDAPIYDLDREEVPGGFDAAFAFDVIEHADDPFAFLTELESRGGIVAVNLLEQDPRDTSLHRELPIQALLKHAVRCRLLRYARLHQGRSHLVVYLPEPAKGWQQVRSRAVLWRVRLRRLAPKWLARAAGVSSGDRSALKGG